jgi:YD repeat-containing protein
MRSACRHARYNDAEGRVAEQSLPFTPGVGAGDVRERTTYDALGRELVRSHPGGATVRRTYGPGTVAITDENSVVTTQTWQAFGDPDEGRLIGVADGKGQPWQYAYDALDRLRSVVAPGGVERTWQYTSKHLLASETHPESGTMMFDAYDYQGRLTRKHDARGTVFEYSYDGNNRLIQVIAGRPDAGGDRVTRFGYEPGSDRRVWASVGYRDLVGIVVDAVDTRWTYDAAGRLESRQDTLDGRTFTSWYTRDAANNVVTLTYPFLDVSARRQVGYGYDVAGRRLTAVVDRGVNRTYASNFAYHPSGAITSYRSGNNLLTQLTYDPLRYWVRSISSGPLPSLRHLRSSRLTSHASPTAGPVTTRPSAMTNWIGWSVPRARIGSQVFAYDAHGNRATVPGVANLYLRSRQVETAVPEWRAVLVRREREPSDATRPRL